MSVIINDPILAEVWKDIHEALEHSIRKHPHYPADPLRRTAITLEEVLEVIHELVLCAENLTKCGLQVARVGNDEKPRTVDDLRKELLHAGAMVVKQLAAMEMEDWVPRVGER